MLTSRGWIENGLYHERGPDWCHTGARAPGHCSRGGIGCPDLHAQDVKRPATLADYADAVRHAAESAAADTPR